MKIIYNSFMGGLFRTLGKFIAFIVLFLIFGYIISSTDTKLADLIGFGKVLAYETSGYGSAEYMDVTVPVNTIGCFTSTTETSSSWYNFGTEHTFGNRRFIKTTRAMISSGSYTWSKDNTYTFRFTLALNPKDYQNWKNGYNVWRLEGSTTTNSSGLTTSNIVSNSAVLSKGNYDNNNYWVYYDLTFTPAQNLKLIWIQFDWGGNRVHNGSCISPDMVAGPGYSFVDFQWYRIDYIRYVPTNNWENVNNSINNQTTIIENNFNQTNENINNIDNSINEIDGYLKDDTIERSHISSGMSDIPRSNALTPFSSFINLPLNWIQNFLSSSNTCSNISIPIPFLDNKNLVLPCMTEFWSKMGALGTLVQLVWVAIVGSRIFNMFYKLTIEVIDPNPNSFSNLSKLKEWEL